VILTQCRSGLGKRWIRAICTCTLDLVIYAAGLSATTILFTDFAASFQGLFSIESCQRLFAAHGPRGAGKPKPSSWQWIMARVYHEFARIGSFSASVKEVTYTTISDAVLSQRAASIGWELIDRILPEVLRPLADEKRHPEAFHHGYRLSWQNQVKGDDLEWRREANKP
jgi:hypothetical protein